ncbi:MAG: hypothetical protein ABIU96_07770 [Rhodanobacter sp.]
MMLADYMLSLVRRRGEGALVGGSDRTIRESFRNVDSHYWTLTLDWTLTLAERDALHARRKAAASAGAVALE